QCSCGRVRRASCYLVLFFFSSRRRHTRCLSDWSSDVCSSDLVEHLLHARDLPAERREELGDAVGEQRQDCRAEDRAEQRAEPARSEERRVGKECRARGAADEERKKRQKADTESVQLIIEQ